MPTLITFLRLSMTGRPFSWSPTGVLFFNYPTRFVLVGLLEKTQGFQRGFQFLSLSLSLSRSPTLLCRARASRRPGSSFTSYLLIVGSFPLKKLDFFLFIKCIFVVIFCCIDFRGSGWEKMPNWELKHCCKHDQTVFLVMVGVFTVVILAVGLFLVLLFYSFGF